MSRATAARTRRSRAMPAASSRSRRIWRSACAPCWPTPRLAAPAGAACAEWLELQRSVASCPAATRCWSRRFRARSAIICVAYPFEGRLAHQTLGMLLTRRLERAARGRWASSPPTTAWRCGDLANLGACIARRQARPRRSCSSQDMLGDDLEAWLAESSLMKRTFRHCAVIAGLIERRSSGAREDRAAGDDVDRPHLRRAAPARPGPHPAGGGVGRCGDGPARHRAPRRLSCAASRAESGIKPLDRVSPLAVPMLLEIGREAVCGSRARGHAARGRRAILSREATEGERTCSS